MIGNPKYNLGDTVSFILDDKLIVGEITIIDRWGTFEDNSAVSYDVLSESQNCLYKHIREDKILPYNEKCKDNV